MAHELKSVRKCDYYRLKKLHNKEKLSTTFKEECSRSTLEKKRRTNHRIDYNYNKSLPIIDRKTEIIQKIKDNQVVILSGETGSGKTTQIPKFCLEAGRGIEGLIGCTQPRRIAALSVADRITEELKDTTIVGSKIRFQDRGHQHNFIKLMTDGILLAETQSDPWLNQYDTLIIDEAHERSLNIDFILGILKNLIKKRKDLKIIITSATIDTEKFSKAFNNAPIIEVSGRTYPVEVRYRTIVNEDLSLAEQSWNALEEILTEKSSGDILVFLPTEQDIKEAIELGPKRAGSLDLNILPLYARLSSNEQKQIFHESSARKIIFSTNIAETSLTIPGIKFVIDSGLARIARYSPGTGTFGLPVEAISQSSADQRKGRCGRISNGICIRLFNEEDYNGRTQFTQPEILRTNLAEVLLRMLSLKIKDIAAFPFVDKPSPTGIKDGFKTLLELNAVTKKKDNYELTPLGRNLSSIPADPRLGRMLIQSLEEGCLKEALVMVGALSIHDPREKPKENPMKAQNAQSIFIDKQSDFLTLLNIWKKWEEMKGSWSKRLKTLCKEYFLSYRRMKEWIDLVQQFNQIAEDRNWKVKTFSGNKESLNYALHRSILSGFLSHVSRKKDAYSYESTRNRQSYIFPGSQLFKEGGEWLVSAEMIRTSKLYLRINCRIQPDWVLELGNHLIKSRYLEPRWDEKKASVVARQEKKVFQFLLSNDIWVDYGSVNPEEARDIFIRQGLMDGLNSNPPSFLQRNRQLCKNALKAENKLRKRGLINENAEIEHYQKVLPNCSSLSELLLFIKREGDKTLKMQEKDFFLQEPKEEELQAHPDHFIKNDEKYKISYHFEPGNSRDGATLRIPKEKIHNFSNEDENKLLPQYLNEQILAYLKSLPKEWRKKFIPLGEHARIISSEIEISEDGLEESLVRYIYKKWNISLPKYLLSRENLPQHVQMKYAIIGKKGKVLKESAKLSELLDQPGKNITEENLEELNKNKGNWFSSWKDLNLSERESIKWKGQTYDLFPGIHLIKNGIYKDWSSSLKEAEQSIRLTTAKLLLEQFSKQIKTFSSSFNFKPYDRYFLHIKGYKKWLDRLWLNILQEPDIMTCRNYKDFQQVLDQVAPILYDKGNTLWLALLSAMEAYKQWRDYIHNLKKKTLGNTTIYLSERELEGESYWGENFLKVDQDISLSEYPRLIGCLKSRTEKGILNPIKDKERELQWMHYKDIYDDLNKDLSPHVSIEKKELIESLKLILQEYKIYLFCQEEKRKMKVSPKRINSIIEEIKITP